MWSPQFPGVNKQPVQGVLPPSSTAYIYMLIEQ